MVDDKRFDLISRRFLMVLRAPCLRFVDKLTIGIINDLHTYRSVFIIFILGFLNLLLTSIWPFWSNSLLSTTFQLTPNYGNSFSHNNFGQSLPEWLPVSLTMTCIKVTSH